MGESGHPGGLDMVDTVLVFMGARSVKLLQKVNPMLTLGCTTTHTVYGQPGTPDTIPTALLYGDVRREKPKLSLKLMPKPSLLPLERSMASLVLWILLCQRMAMGLLCLLIILFSHQTIRIPKFNAIYFSKLKNS